MHPLDKVLEWLSGIDFAVLDHGFSQHGRDYNFFVEDVIGSDPGQHVLTFTHCVKIDYETRVRDDVWPRSWSDDFTNYERWQEEGEPDGYVWGTNWSNAYPGLKAITDSSDAHKWQRRLGKPMYETTLETDRFFMRLIFHDIHTTKMSDDTSTISKFQIPLERMDELKEILKEEHGIDTREGENMIYQEDYSLGEWKKILDLFQKYWQRDYDLHDE